MTFAQIDNTNTVLNILLMNTGDFQDPTYTWVDVTNLNPQPSIGWIYNGSTFSSSGLPNTAYGNPVVFSTNNVTDSYSVLGDQTYTFPTGTSQIIAYLKIAISENISQFQMSMQNFLDAAYTPDVRLNLIGLYLNAQANGFTNRINYLSQILTWENSVISYAAWYIVSVQAMVSIPSIQSFSFNGASIAVANPLINAMTAIQINS